MLGFENLLWLLGGKLIVFLLTFGSTAFWRHGSLKGKNRNNVLNLFYVKYFVEFIKINIYLLLNIVILWLCYKITLPFIIISLIYSILLGNVLTFLWRANRFKYVEYIAIHWKYFFKKASELLKHMFPRY